MSLPIVQVVFFLFTLFSFSKSNIAIADTPKLIENCNRDNVKSVIDPDLCLKILKSQEKIVSSTNQIDLAVAVIESGISNGTNTRTYIENVLKKRNLDPNLKGVLQECNSSYVSAIGSLQSAQGEAEAGEYQTSSYDLLIASSDNIDQCRNAVASKKIKDATILLGNKVLTLFGSIGYNVVYDLYIRSPPTSNFGHDRVN
ncbi:hypothetical protein ACS0TY_018244 [Phlomoides rotata]